MTSCAKHAQKPVAIYCDCPGCEIEALNAELRDLKAEQMAWKAHFPGLRYNPVEGVIEEAD